MAHTINSDDVEWLFNRAKHIQQLYQVYGGTRGAYTSAANNLSTNMAKDQKESKQPADQDKFTSAVGELVRQCRERAKAEGFADNENGWVDFIKYINDRPNKDYYIRCLLTTLDQLNYVDGYRQALPESLQKALTSNHLLLQDSRSHSLLAPSSNDTVQIRGFLGGISHVTMNCAGLPPAIRQSLSLSSDVNRNSLPPSYHNPSSYTNLSPRHGKGAE